MEAKAEFDSISSYSDAISLSQICMEKAEEARKNAIYDTAVNLASGSVITQVEEAVKEFEKISGWKDADQKKIETLSKAEQLKNAEKKAANKKKTAVILSIIAIIVCVAVVVAAIQIVKSKKYDSADDAYIAGDYITAIKIWSELEDYKDSQNRIQDAAKQIYNESKNLIEQGEYAAAINKLDSIASYLSIAEDKGYCYYMIALVYTKNGDYSEALTQLSSASAYAESGKLRQFCVSVLELQSINNGERHNLREMYEAISVLASDLDQTSLLNTECFNMMLSLNGNWYGFFDYKMTFDDGRINVYDEGYLKYEWDVIYRSGKYYMQYTGEKGKSSYQLISNYSGEGDNSFTYEDYFYGDTIPDDYDTYNMTRR